MGQLLAWPRHHWKHCTNCDGCMLCLGGLAYCTRCAGLEGALPTHCPGQRMSMETCDAVYAGRADYYNGSWIMKTRDQEIPTLRRRS